MSLRAGPVSSHANIGDYTVSHSRGLYRAIYRLALVASDAIAVALAFGAAYSLRFDFGLALVNTVEPNLTAYVRLVLMLVPLWLVLFWIMGLYDYRYLLGGTVEYARALSACATGMMVVVVVTFLIPDFQISRSWLLMSWALSSLFVCSGRLALRRIAYRQRRHGYFVSPTVIVGTNREAVALAHQLSDQCSSGMALMGFVAAGQRDHDVWQAVPDSSPVLVLGDLSSLLALARSGAVEEVVVATTALTREQLMLLYGELAALPGVNLHLSSGLYEIFTSGMRITTRNYVPLMSLNRMRLDQFEQLFKTVLDYALILFCLPFLLPIFGVISVLIKMDTSGPVFHKRRVIGVGGGTFDAFKFRTMIVNGDDVLSQYPDLEEELRANHKLKDDPRVTRVGRWLRSTSLDELPQLINVVLGQMSLVGPRMITKEESELYGQMKYNLLTVKPGLTGLWQVSGRSDLTYDERVQLDMHYIRNYSIWMDIQILFFQTIPSVLKRRGAY